MFILKQYNMDYYNIIGVDKNSSQEEIKKAYRKKSLLLHPDRPNGNNEDFVKLNTAYETLSDVNKKTNYDNSMFRQQIPIDPINELFNIFNHRGGDNIFRKFNETINLPMPIIRTLHISLEDSYNGVSMPIDIKRYIFNNNIKEEENETLYITIPQGIDNNEIIKINKKGNIDENGNEGCIKIYIKLVNNTDFIRKGIDLYQKKDITLRDCLCGFNYDIKHINGKSYSLQNKKGNIISPNFKKGIEGLGMIRDGIKGRLYIEYNILFPKTISEEKLSILEEALKLDY